MVMKGIIAVIVAVWLFALAACNKPTNESCRQAIEHMRVLLGTENAHADIAGEIRRCRSGSKKEAVDCAIAANSRAELEACHLVKHEDDPAEPGSATPTPGSAAPAPGSDK
jgi:hypothetical protein